MKTYETTKILEAIRECCLELKEENELKIIGHPPELRHLLLLLALKKPLDEMATQGRYLLLGTGLPELAYDLTQTLTENLETNEELRKFVYQLVVKK